MICPVCRTHIPDNSYTCPACRADLSLAHSMPEAHNRYCSRCGALVSPGEIQCQSCGMPMAEQEESMPVRMQGKKTEPSEAEITNSIPRIESALPSEPSSIDTALEDAHVPKMRSVLLAAFGALVVVGGLTLAIAHPWDPDAYSTRATEEADTSYAGFPGEIEHLSGQDKPTDLDEQTEIDPSLSGDEKSYAQLHDAYLRLGNFAAALDSSEEKFYEIAFGTDTKAIEEAKNEAEKLAIELSNLIETIGQIDTSSGTYTETVANFRTLGNWLRNRSDAQVEAWNLALASSNRVAERESIEAPIKNGQGSDGQNAYAKLFEGSYADWEPERP